jgi:polygalacturonase
MLRHALFLAFILLTLAAQAAPPDTYNVRAYGAKGDSVTLDSDAINRAIAAAAKSGGGTVLLPAGRYRSYSIRLRSHVALYLDQGAVLLAATPVGNVGYDAPEPAASDKSWGRALSMGRD